jgi:outer membrane protein
LLSSFQSTAQDFWSLEKCILHSQDASIAINQSQLGISFAEVTLNQSKQSRYPNLNGNSNLNWNFGRTIDPTSNAFITETFFSNNFGVSTGVSLFEGFRINNNIKQAKVELEAAKSDTDQMRRDVALLVASNYLNVLFAKENISVSEKQLDLSRQQLDQTRKLIDAGAQPESERLNLEAQIAQSEQMLIEATNNLDISFLQLKQVLRLDPSFPFDIKAPEDVAVTTDPDMVDFEEAFILAQKNRPDLYGSEMRLKSAEIGISLAKGLNYPSVRIGGSLGTAYSNQAIDFINPVDVINETQVFISSANPLLPLDNEPITLGIPSTNFERIRPSYSTQLDNNLSYGFGLGLSIPIYNNGSTKSGVQRAKLNAISAQLSYEQLLEDLKITVQQSLGNARAAKKKLEASEKTLAAQTLAFKNTTKRLEIGAANTFEWENQKTQMENAEFQRLMDKYDYLFKIKILEFYLGKPLKL